MTDQDGDSKDAHHPDVACLPLEEPPIEASKSDVPASEGSKCADDPEKQADSLNQHKGVLAEEDYSAFTTNQKRVIMVIGSLTAWLSPMTGSIYYPALNSVRTLLCG